LGVVNKTGIEIYALYVASNNEDDWGEDILSKAASLGLNAASLHAVRE